jgi:hypothetical protein
VHEDTSKNQQFTPAQLCIKLVCGVPKSCPISGLLCTVCISGQFFDSENKLKNYRNFYCLKNENQSVFEHFISKYLWPNLLF